MTIAPMLQQHMDKQGIPYELMSHDREVVATRIAQAAHIPGNSFAKGVLLKSDSGFLVAVVPANRHVDLAELSHRRHERLGLASEEEARRIFADCDPGAVPACAEAYGIPMIVDSDLTDFDEIYMEAGDHKSLIHITRQGFARLTAMAELAPISRAH
ncbi:aminoacyl-tRNA deacylase [Kordiimonas aestuarii]|uniref:aminoacyl-tRNA deacylase n=1 Tax=Kordiimonas aestuarii TaxID=1005925 RepID=UPI0021D1D86F|nr:YbaK/EbsC family protein [Kordiimonas aestuarii]